MAVCPNRNSAEWKALEEKLGIRGAYRVWLENNESLPGISNRIKPEEAQLIKEFTAATNSEILIDRTMMTPGRGEFTEDGKIIVYINPDILEQDTIIHEFAHVYIELLGGIDSPQIQVGLKRLKGSSLEKEVTSNYPHLTGAKLQKEILATAIGREGVEIFNATQQTEISKFDAWLRGIFGKLKRLLGIPPNIAKQFAREIIENRLQRSEFKTIKVVEKFEQRSKQTAKNAITRIRAESHMFEVSADENSYIGKKNTPVEGLNIERQSKYVQRIQGKTVDVNEFMERGAHVGTFIDDIGRDVFTEVFEEDNMAVRTKQDYLAGVNRSKTGKKDPAHKLSLTDEVFESIKTTLRETAEEFKSKGYTAVSEEMFVYSPFHPNVKAETGYDGVGGTLDLFLKDPKGVYHIVDFKNSKFNSLQFHDTNLYSDSKMPNGNIREALVDKWATQQTVYKVLTEGYSEFLNVGSINALQLSTVYSTAEQTGNNIELTEMVLGKDKAPIIASHKSDISSSLVKLKFDKKVADRLKNDIVEGNIRSNDDVMDDVNELSKQEKLVQAAIKKIEAKIQKIQSTERSTEDAGKLEIAKLERLVVDMRDVRAKDALIKYIQMAHTELAEAEEKLNSVMQEKNPLRALSFIENVADSFNMESLVELSEEFKNDPELKAISNIANDSVASKLRIDKIIQKLSVEIISEMAILPYDKIKKNYEQSAEREFGKKNPDLKGEERKVAKREFINEFMADNYSEIEKESKKYRIESLTILVKDLGLIEAFGVNPKDQNSEFVDMLVQIAEEADTKTRLAYMAVVPEMDTAIRAYKEYVGGDSSMKNFYAPLLKEVEGVILPELAVAGDEKYNEIKNGKYKGTPVETLYDLFISVSIDRDSLVLPKYRLGNHLPIMMKDNIERIAEDGLLATIYRSVRDTFNVTAKDVDLNNTLVQEHTHKLTDKVRVIVNEANEERKFVPMHYRTKVEEKDRSYDLGTLLLLDYHQALNFKHKQETLYLAEALRRTLSSAEVIQRAGIAGRTKTSLSGDIITSSGAISKTLAALDNVLRQRWYGVGYKGDPQLIKIVKAAKAYTSFVSLTFNPMSAGANFFQGSAMTWLEAMGTEFYTNKNILRAQSQLASEFPKVMSDVGERIARSKLMLFTSHLNTRNSFNPFENNMSKDTKIKNLAEPGSLMMLNTNAEFLAQSMLMLSALDNIKVFNEEGRYLSKDGKTATDNREDAMTYYEAWEVGYTRNRSGGKSTITSEQYEKLSAEEKNKYSYGILIINPNVASSEISAKKAESIDSIVVHARLLGSLNRHAFGNYSNINKSDFEGTAFGMAVSHMRGWLITSILRRYRGAGSLLIKDDTKLFNLRFTTNDELRIEDKYLNQETGKLEQGMYVTTARYFARTIEELRQMQFELKGEKWNELTDHEKSNIRKTLTEMGLSIATFLAAMALIGADDDDDEGSTVRLYAAFYSRRLYSELITYVNPVEALRTFKTPAISLNLVQSMFRAMSQLTFSPTEEYKKGPNKGKNKALVKLAKVTPLKMFTRDVQSALNFFNY